jgi:hypothetical protein
MDEKKINESIRDRSNECVGVDVYSTGALINKCWVATKRIPLNELEDMVGERDARAIKVAPRKCLPFGVCHRPLYAFNAIKQYMIKHHIVEHLTDGDIIQPIFNRMYITHTDIVFKRIAKHITVDNFWLLNIFEPYPEQTMVQFNTHITTIGDKYDAIVNNLIGVLALATIQNKTVSRDKLRSIIFRGKDTFDSIVANPNLINFMVF